MKITGNEPASPTLFYDEITGKPNGFSVGLTIHQELAKAAMQGMCSNIDPLKEHFDETWYRIAEKADRMATVMIWQLNKNPK